MNSGISVENIYIRVRESRVSHDTAPLEDKGVKALVKGPTVAA